MFRDEFSTSVEILNAKFLKAKHWIFLILSEISFFTSNQTRLDFQSELGLVDQSKSDGLNIALLRHPRTPSSPDYLNP